MAKTLASCFGGILVAIIIGSLLWRTAQQESKRPTGPFVAVLANGPTSTGPVQAFANTDALGDYLLANASKDSQAITRLCASPGAVKLQAGTRAVLQRYTGPGQAQVKITTGPHAGQILYVSFAVLQGSQR